ncbi:putative S-adenosylmethionine-dependent methyltransferase [compost metagenome]
MERLDINSAPERANIEASIHFARYSVATPFVKDKRVLDIACGEGYGSYLLKQAGAGEVVGVDVFADAVNRAARSFGGPGIEFIAADATTIEDRFPAEYFDVIVSCETIEHIEDPATYLQSLKRVAKKDAIIIISCPNDYWYFPEEHQRNPYHLRKYRLEEFQQLAVGVLGDNVNWSIGTAVFGFGSTSLDIERDYETVPDSWMKFNPAQGAYLVNGGEKPEFNAENCSYYFGIWNAPEITNGAAVFPVSMDAYARMVQAIDGTLLVDERLKLDALQMEADTYKSDLRKVRLNYQATLTENELIKERLHTLQTETVTMQAEMARMQAGYNRYLRLGGLLPRPVRALLKRFYGIVRGSLN